MHTTYIQKAVVTVLLVSSMFLGGHANSESIRHFEGKKANSYAEAIALLKTYNMELAGILAKESLGLSELGKIHELTYTLENALKTMQSEISVTAELLETLHQASERTDTGKAKKLGEAYLELSNQLISGEH